MAARTPRNRKTGRDSGVPGRRVRAPASSLEARDRDIAAGLSLSVERLRAILSAVVPTRRRGEVRWYRWPDIAFLVESKEMWKARREAREKLRRHVTGSRYWVNGFPHLVAQWDSRNELLPYQVSQGSNRKVRWKCHAGPDHEWTSVVATRVRGAGCPFCTGRRVSVTNSLATCHPDIAAQWHPKKNRSLQPDQVVRSAKVRVWWKCPAGPDHEWRTTIHSRTSGRRVRGCPFCAGNRVSQATSLATLHPVLARQWDRSRNGELTAFDVTTGSHQEVWWKCPRIPSHVWRASVKNRAIGGTNCPVCAKAPSSGPVLSPNGGRWTTMRKALRS